MSQLVQKSRANFHAEAFLIAFHKIPQIFKKQNDLRWQHRPASIRKFRTGK